MSTIYTPDEISKLAESGRILSSVLTRVAEAVRPGVTTKELDSLAYDLIKKAGAKPAFLNYQEGGGKPYPASLCTSINEEIVHCIPGKRVLAEGDIISLDLGVSYKGLITDMAVTVPVGIIPKKVEKLLSVTKESLEQGCAVLRPGASIGDIGHAIEQYAKKNKLGVVRDLVGHGVGHHVHEPPQIPNVGVAGKGQVLDAGMVLAIEPMLTLGSPSITMLADGWGIATADRSLSAHFEKTVVITKNGHQVLTQ